MGGNDPKEYVSRRGVFCFPFMYRQFHPLYVPSKYLLTIDCNAVIFKEITAVKGVFFLKKTHGAQTVETYPGKRVLKSGAVGATNAEEVRWLIQTLLSNAVSWKAQGWGYIVDISKMAPVTPDVSAELVTLHKKLTEAGCKAMAFVDFGSFVTAAQAKQHQQQSKAGIQEGHFKNEAEALAWIEKIIK